MTRDPAAGMTRAGADLDADRSRWAALHERWQARELRDDDAVELMRLAMFRSEHAIAIAVRSAYRERLDGRARRLLLALGAWADLRLGDIDAARAGLAEVDALADGPDAGVDAVAARVAVSLAAYDRRADETDRQLAAGIEAATQAGDRELRIRFEAVAASARADVGELGPAIDALDAAVGDAEASGSSLLLGDVLYARGDVLFGAGRLDEATRDYRAVVALRQRSGVSTAVAQAALGECRIETGDLRRARTDLEAAAAGARQTGDRSHLVACLAALARAHCLDDPDAAMAIVGEALDVGPTPGYAWALALGSAAWIAWLRHDDAAARTHAVAAESAASLLRTPLVGADMGLLLAATEPEPGRRSAYAAEAARAWDAIGNPVWTARARLAAAIATQPDASDVLLASDEQLRQLGDGEIVAGLAGGPIVSTWRQARGIRVQVLGGFGVTVDGAPLAATAWQSRKARDLLKLLVLARGPVTKDRLGEQLWPEDEPDAVANRLSVALATLRAGLDPERRRDPSHAIASDGRSLWLERRHVATDLDRFLALAANADEPGPSADAPARRAALRIAESAYTGDLLPEDEYADWAIEARERLRVTALDLDRALADLALAQGDFAEAIRYSLRLLDRDPYDEPAHLGLVRALGRAGRHGEARRAYASYVTRLRELDVDPAPFPALGRP